MFLTAKHLEGCSDKTIRYYFLLSTGIRVGELVRLTESGVELRLSEMGKKLGVEKVHPHKFRRTMATRAIEKGMLIEQVQKILGHEQKDTTLRYAMVNQNNVKLSHRKYIS